MKDNNSIDLSPGTTTIAFDPTIPLLRVPVPAGGIDDPSKGPYVLAFKDEDSWRHAWHACESRLLEQCEAGARMGCSISASNKCQPPWWKSLFQLGKVTSDQIAEREACEEREMKACIVDSRETCKKYAKDTCRPTFSNVRIAKSDQVIDPRFTTHNYKTVKQWDGKSNVKSDKRDDGKCDKLICSSTSDSSRNKFETTYQGGALMGEDSSEGHPKRPIWGETSIKGDEFGTHGDGFEGGLVRPKITSQQLKPSNDKVELSKPGVPIWNFLQQHIISKLKDLKFVQKGS